MTLIDQVIGAPGAATVEHDRYCVRCSYDLRELPVAGNCPECGAPVAESIKGNLLQHATLDYIATLRSGLSLVLNGWLAFIVAMLAMFGAVGLRGLASVSPGGTVHLVWTAVGTLITAVMLVGYWQYTEPDPGTVARENTNAARKVIRVAVSVQAAMQAITCILQFAGFSGPSQSMPVAILSFATMLGSMVASLVQFFATLVYTGQLAERVPDTYIVQRAKRYVWQLPVVAVVGLIALLLGPLIALVMYWNLLDRLRKHLKSIESSGQPARLKGALG